MNTDRHAVIRFKKRHSTLAWILPALTLLPLPIFFFEPDWLGFWEIVCAVLFVIWGLVPFFKKGRLEIRSHSFHFDHYPDLVAKIAFSAVEGISETPHGLSLIYSVKDRWKTLEVWRCDVSQEDWLPMVTRLAEGIRTYAPSANIHVLHPA